jgi:hypothetical protein
MNGSVASASGATVPRRASGCSGGAMITSASSRHGTTSMRACDTGPSTSATSSRRTSSSRAIARVLALVTRSVTPGNRTWKAPSSGGSR